ncbi:hypothetical protein CC2G_012334 [Coprinopsis cinerea AmutBmut pab1-1]|jgi:hypothetical protein|nr:hypothetical protein CC2G_012334 [Coprinopsis cinerea AmutBmut pab1-1]
MGTHKPTSSCSSKKHGHKSPASILRSPVSSSCLSDDKRRKEKRAKKVRWDTKRLEETMKMIETTLEDGLLPSEVYMHTPSEVDENMEECTQDLSQLQIERSSKEGGEYMNVDGDDVDGEPELVEQFTNKVRL